MSTGFDGPHRAVNQSRSGQVVFSELELPELDFQDEEEQEPIPCIEIDPDAMSADMVKTRLKEQSRRILFLEEDVQALSDRCDALTAVCEEQQKTSEELLLQLKKSRTMSGAAVGLAVLSALAGLAELLF